MVFRCSTRNPRSAARGLTLAELLVVIAIITISVTLLLPVVINLARVRRVGSGARAIQAKLHGAKVKATAQRAVHGLIIRRLSQAEAESPQIQYACLITDVSDTSATREQEEFLPKGLTLSLAVGGGSPVPWPTNAPFVRFGADGTVRPDPLLPTPLMISLENAADSTDRTLIVVRRTGAIEVLEKE